MSPRVSPELTVSHGGTTAASALARCLALYLALARCLATISSDERRARRPCRSSLVPFDSSGRRRALCVALRMLFLSRLAIAAMAMVTIAILSASCRNVADGLSLESCNDAKCCGQSCCNTAGNFCRCTSDATCATPDQSVCRDGVCEPRFTSCDGDACCELGYVCTREGAIYDSSPSTCAPRCDAAHTCPPGYSCSAGACVGNASGPSCYEDGGRCADRTVCVYSRCVTPCSDASACGAGFVCLAGGCFIDRGGRANCCAPTDPACSAKHDAGRDAEASTEAAAD
jgi:hypothetical protein